MTIHVLPIDAVTSALVDMLRDNLGGIRVYRAGDVFGDQSYPFLVVHRIAGEPPSGPPLTGGEDDICLVYQVDAVGQRTDQAEALAVRARTRIVASDGAGGWQYPIVVAGWRCTRRLTQVFAGTTSEGQPRHAVFASRARYELDWTPA